MIGWLVCSRAWQRRQFGRSTDTVGPLKHARKELDECVPGCDPVEYADVVFLVWQAAHRSGVSPLRFVWALWLKLFENMVREWPEPVEGEPCEHVREGL